MAKNKHILIGQVCEKIAEGYLLNRGFGLVERNFRKKFGEIDIIVEKDGVLHFVEVKSGSFRGEFPKDGSDRYRPEDHMTSQKKIHLSRVIQSYLLEKNVSEEKEWTVDVAVVNINVEKRKARVSILKSVLLE